MKLRHVLVLALVPLSLGACKKKAPVEGPTPGAQFSDTGSRTRADSLAMYEAAERERLARMRSGELARNREVLTEMIFFEFDSSELSADAEDRLREKIAILRANPGIRLRIEGHADERGSTEYNLALGQRRAETVRNFLDAYGVSGDRLVTISYGKERPLDESSGELAWARNRRAEFVVMSGEVSSTMSGVR